MNLDLSLSEDRAILQEFIQESKEGIEQIESILLSLDADSDSPDKIDDGQINKIFRTFHSIKGSAGFIGLSRTSELTHHAETLLDQIRKGKQTLTKEHIDLFLQLCDFLRELLDHIQTALSEEAYASKIDSYIKKLNKLLGDGKYSRRSGSSKKRKQPNVPADSAETTGTPVPEESSDRGDPGFEQLVTPEMIKQFQADALEMLDAAEQDLLELEKSPSKLQAAESAFRSIHSLKGNAGFLGYEDVVQVCHELEQFLEQLRSGGAVFDAGQSSLVLQVIDFIRKALENMDEERPPLIPGKFGLIDLMKETLGGGETEASSRAVQSTPASEENATPDAEPKTGSEPTGEAADRLPGKEKENPPTEKTEGSPRPQKSLNTEFIRVDVNKLNHLMDLVGELVIAESMVSQHPEIMGRDLPGFEKAVIHLQKNIRELQELATSMRMVPLTATFRKMIRLVRDLSRKSNKKVELEIRGGDTEVDRSVIEHISDPLVHIIRNAVDHGIEPSEERIRKGKPPEGKITLDAKQVGGEIWISITDDGRGLDREKILAKALQRGLVPEDHDHLPDEEVWRLIFTPGFSTAQEVTAISGRGVGMDVVVRNIEKIRGRVDIFSEKDRGTTLKLRIPLTTAIIDGMLVRVENSLYAIPVLDIRESLQVNSHPVVRMVDGQEVIRIRDQIFPVVRLHEFYRLTAREKELAQGILILVENGGKSLCLFADELIGQRQLVIKPVPDYLGHIPGVSGCAILGNGDICLILDIANVIKISEQATQAREIEYV